MRMQGGGKRREKGEERLTGGPEPPVRGTRDEGTPRVLDRDSGGAESWPSFVTGERITTDVRSYSIMVVSSDWLLLSTSTCCKNMNLESIHIAHLA